MEDYNQFFAAFKDFIDQEENYHPQLRVKYRCNRDFLTYLITNDRLLPFLFRMGLMTTLKCDKCGDDMTLYKKTDLRDGYVRRCTKRTTGKKCDTTKSIRYGSWFTGSFLTIPQIMKITYEIVRRTARDDIAYELGINKNTITNWTQFVRETMLHYLDNNSERLGGPGVVVEIDESVYDTGHSVLSEWFLGGVERKHGKMFFVPVQDRTADTLTTLIDEWVLPGTTIHSDCWKAYDRLGDLGCNYLKFNRSINFVDPTTGACTNTIKNFLPAYNGKWGSFPNYLGHCLFLRLARMKDGEPFLRFLHIVRNIDWSTMTSKIASKRKADSEGDSDTDSDKN